MNNVATAVARHALVGLVRSRETAEFSDRERTTLLLCSEQVFTIRGLAEAQGDLAKSIVSRTVSALETRGCLVKRDDPKDGRNVFVQITPEGRQAVTAIGRVFADAIRLATPKAAA